MLKNHFPMRVVAYDADGIERNVSCLADIVKLSEEKAERYNDDESKRFVRETNEALAPKTKGSVSAEVKEPAKVVDEPAAKKQTPALASGNKKPAAAPAKKAPVKVAAKKAPAKKKSGKK